MIDTLLFVLFLRATLLFLSFLVYVVLFFALTVNKHSYLRYYVKVRLFVKLLLSLGYLCLGCSILEQFSLLCHIGLVVVFIGLDFLDFWHYCRNSVEVKKFMEGKPLTVYLFV